MQRHDFHKIGIGLCGTGLLLSFFIFLPTLRGLGIGIWPQSESSIVALNICALVSTLGLFLLSLRSMLVFRLFKNPLVFIPFLIGTLSILLLPFHDLPVRSLLGSVRTGEGIVWWLSLGALSASGIFLWRLKFWRKAIIYAAAFSFIICFILSLTHKYFHHYIAPFYFPDYLAFMILAFLPLAYLYWSKKQKGFLFYLPFYILLNVLLYMTENKAMIGFGLTAPLLFWGLSAFEKGRKTLSLGIISLIPVFWMTLFLGISNIDTKQGFYAFTETGIFKTVASRAYLVDASVQSQTEQPARLLTGHGWGSYVDHLTNYQPSQWLDFTDFKRDQWDGLTFDHFHSHNMFIETLNTIGITGLILLCLYFFFFVSYAKKSLQQPAILLSAGLMTWASLWFLLPIHLPYLVFAATSACKRTSLLFLDKLKPFKNLLSVILLIIAVLQIISAYILYNTARMTDSYEPNAIKIADIQKNCVMEYNDHGAGGLHLSRLMLDRLRYTVDLADTENSKPEKEKPDAIPDHVDHINHYFCQSALYGQEHTPSARLTIARLMTRGEILLALHDYIDGETRRYYYDGWKEELRQWLINTPDRSDQATPYLLYHIIHGQEDRSVEIVDLIYKQNPDDPIGLWFKGLSLLNSTKTSADGIRMMRKAFDNGIERFITVEDNIKAMLKT